jgi:lipoprotein-anchoring transpeptidase ErfK/SrfK
MTDLFLQPRESNRGCLILGLLGVLCLALVAWIVLRDKNTEPGMGSPDSGQIADEPGGDSSQKVGTDGPGSKTSPSTPGTEKSTVRKSPEALVAEVAQVRTLTAQGEFEKARSLARQLATDSRNAETKRAAEQILGELHLKMAFSKVPMAEKQEYQVRPGDSLGGIAKKFNSTVPMLQKGNGISGTMIRKGEKLQILPGNFRVLVDKSDYTLTVLYDGKFFVRFLVGTGKDDKTPEGKFKIVDKIEKPDWWRPDGKKIDYGDKENLLGTHWLALDARSYGIHGTWEPETIGKPLSAGCVRMRNEEVGLLFDLLPVGTPVEITK